MRGEPSEEGSKGGEERIRSVERAIDLLLALNRSPLSTLADLHRQTGIPKSSIVRLLRALESEGLVAQTASYSAYRLLKRVTSLSSGYPDEPPVIAVAEALMIEFTRAEGWPLALAMFDTDAVVVRASSIPYTSLAIGQSSIDMRLSLVGFALGQAYLAFCPPDQRRTLLERVRRSNDEADAGARDIRRTSQLLAQVRERGYALRSQLFEPRSSSIAVPVFENGQVVASLGMTWLAAAMSPQNAIAYLPRLVRLSKAISRALEGAGTASSGLATG